MREADSRPATPTPAKLLVLDEVPASRASKDLLVLGDGQSYLLADMVRDLGRDRFARFWHANSTSVSAAFASASGAGIAAWTRQWLVRTYGPPPAPPGVRAGEVAWLAVALPCLVVAAGRRRERVLVERLTAPNTGRV